MRSTYRSRQIEKSNLNTSKTPWFFKNPISSKPNTNLQLYQKKSVSHEMTMKIRFKKDNSSLSSHKTKTKKKHEVFFFQKQNMSWSWSRFWFRTGTACLRKKPFSSTLIIPKTSPNDKKMPCFSLSLPISERKRIINLSYNPFWQVDEPFKMKIYLLRFRLL